MKKNILLLFFILGFSSIFSQTLIVREFIISFGGNELGIALFYFFWLFWVGIGAFLVLTFLGKFLNRYFLKITSFYPILAILEFFLFIFLRKFAKLEWWELFSIGGAGVYLFIFTSFFSLFSGIIFTLGTFWLKRISSYNSTLTISYAYIIESLGSFIAGSLVTLLVLKLFYPLELFILLSVFFSLILIFLSINLKDRFSLIFNIFIFVVFVIFSFNGKAVNKFVQRLRLQVLFPKANLIYEVYTPYQHLLLGEFSSQVLVFSGGQIISNLPEKIEADKESAIFVSQANFPKDILILGYGVENVINSLLKFPFCRITYCLEDRIYYEVVKKHLPLELEKVFRDKRLEVVFGSPRLFLKENEKKFDLVVVYTPDPTNLFLNSYFTKDFYILLKKNLKENGIVATKIRSAENFIGSEIRNYGSSLYYTLKEVFSKIVITPQETNWFFAGDINSSITDNPLILEERLRNIIPQDFSFKPEGFRSIFLKERIEFINKLYKENPLFEKNKLINSDNQPLTFFLNLLVFAHYTNSYLVKLLKGIFLVNINLFLIPIFLAFFARILFLFRIENFSSNRTIFNIKIFQFFSGFLGFSFHLFLIFLFQNKFGRIFQLIGLVNALFMLGLFLGGFFGKNLLKRFNIFKIIFLILIVQAIFIFIVYFLYKEFSFSYSLLFILFILFFLFEGILTGASYPLCAFGLEKEKLSLDKVASNLVLLDHFGGALAGLISGLFILPLLGILKSIVILSLVCLFLACLFCLELIKKFEVLIKKERRPNFLSFPYIRTSYVIFVIVLTFIIWGALLEKKKLVFEEKIAFEAGECYRQNEPFVADVCFTSKGKEYILETKNFSPNIKGFGGPINLLVRIDDTGKIQDIKALEHHETIQYVRSLNTFLEQFKGRFLKGDFSLKEVDAISGAT
ncbi:MAG: FMN-binding protein, partial [Candidatus Aenigmatarchaeota archaeon]